MAYSKLGPLIVEMGFSSSPDPSMTLACISPVEPHTLCQIEVSLCMMPAARVVNGM